MRITCLPCHTKSEIPTESVAIVTATSGQIEIWWTCPLCHISRSYDVADEARARRIADHSVPVLDVDRVVSLMVHLGCQRVELGDLDAELQKLTEAS